MDVFEGLEAGGIDVFGAEGLDDEEGDEVLLLFFEDGVVGQLAGVEKPLLRGPVFVQHDGLGDAQVALQGFFEEEEVEAAELGGDLDPAVVLGVGFVAAHL